MANGGYMYVLSGEDASGNYISKKGTIFIDDLYIKQYKNNCKIFYNQLFYWLDR